MASASLLGVQDVLAALRSYEGPEMEKRERRATLDGARALVGPARDAAPHKTGRLAASTRLSQVRSAGNWIGYKVQVGGKGARQANIIVGGSKDHRIFGGVGHPLITPWGPRAVVHVRGVRPNPYVERVGEREAPAVLEAMGRSIARTGG